MKQPNPRKAAALAILQAAGIDITELDLVVRTPRSNLDTLEFQDPQDGGLGDPAAISDLPAGTPTSIQRDNFSS